MRLPRQATFALALLPCFAFIANVEAIEPPTKACKSDREKFCADTKPGDGKYGACMKQHLTELSDECKASVKAMRDARRGIKMSCKAETDKYCPSGQGSMIKCLESHASDLGQACTEALKARPGTKRT